MKTSVHLHLIHCGAIGKNRLPPPLYIEHAIDSPAGHSITRMGEFSQSQALTRHLLLSDHTFISNSTCLNKTQLLPSALFKLASFLSLLRTL